VNIIEFACFFRAQFRVFHGPDLKSFAGDVIDDLSHVAVGYCIWLDHGKC
jgi:hypothetical protein